MAVPTDNDKHAVVPHLVEQPGQFGSVALGAGQLLLMQPPAVRLVQRSALKHKFKSSVLTQAWPRSMEPL